MRPPTSAPLALALFLAGLVASLLAGCGSGTSQEEAELLFAHEVYPLLEAKCFACHGDDPSEIEGDFDMRSREGLLTGGESGEAALVPGHPENSPMYVAATRAVKDFEMPPKENDRLSDKQTELLRRWIAGGAPWPDDERRLAILESTEWDYADGIRVETSGALSETWANRRYDPDALWAFKPRRDVRVPWAALGGDSTGRNPIDAFIARKLAEAGLEPAGRADKLTLIRRASYDLTGLPPTPTDVRAFLDDPSPDAFEEVIERLLESPRYGEQWGRHWLDVARYADTGGGSNDFERPNAWRYRDYVIRVFNEDKPFNEFIREQVAGDEIDPDDPAKLVAAGFLRMGPWEHTAMSVAAETRQLYLDDVTNSVGEAFLSLPLRCASCHDHKFDPIPTRDYYRIQAAFAPVQFAEREAAYLPQENLGRFEKSEARVRRLIEEAERDMEAISAKAEAAAKAWMEERGLAYAPPKERRNLPEDQRPPRDHGLTDQDLGTRKALNKRLQLLGRQLDRYEPLAYSVYNGPPRTVQSAQPMRMPDDVQEAPTSADVQPTMVLAGGSVYAPTDTVGPGLLSGLAGVRAHEMGEPAETIEPVLIDSIPARLDGRREALAAWLADADHPLTTRSIVNRVWQYHFGQGIAGNPNNFGVMGKRPTHPDLLDWLTNGFVENGWSIKQLHRLIMTSDVYQRSGHHPAREELEEQDPDNELLAYFSPRRLAAEELRDAMLKISGELDLTMGGLPIKPEINLEVALQPRHTMGSIAPAYQPSPTPEERNRRTVYAYRYRGLPDPMLEVFNRPGADLSCERRTASTVTPQAFTLLNSRNSYSRALAMAHRLENEAETLPEQIERAIWLAWNRPPRPNEVAQSQSFVEAKTSEHAANPPEAPPYPTRVERTMFEEMTGESFTYTERLDVYEDYVADLQPTDVGPETRALADLCLVLFNANEFVYVY